jgi:hypothetical protein
VVAAVVPALAVARSAAARLFYGVTRGTTGALWSIKKKRVPVNALSPVIMRMRGWSMWPAVHGASCKHAYIAKSLKAGKIQCENMKDDVEWNLNLNQREQKGWVMK